MATASAFSSPDHEKYELMNSVSTNDEIWRTSRSSKTNCKCCNKATIVFFILGLVSGAGILVLLYHFAFQSSAIPPLVPKTKNGTILGCSSFSDVKILVNEAGGIIPQQTKCGHKALGNVNKFLKCFEEATGLSSQCSSCYGALTNCGKNKCLPDCILGPSAKCSSCICANCIESFKKCMKIPCTIIPHSQHKCGNCPGSL
jgi:hypothetical protein